GDVVAGFRQFRGVAEIEPGSVEDLFLLRLVDFMIDEVTARDLEYPLGRIHEQGRMGVVRVHGVSFLEASDRFNSKSGPPGGCPTIWMLASGARMKIGLGSRSSRIDFDSCGRSYGRWASSPIKVIGPTWPPARKASAARPPACPAPTITTRVFDRFTAFAPLRLAKPGRRRDAFKRRLDTKLETINPVCKVKTADRTVGA